MAFSIGKLLGSVSAPFKAVAATVRARRRGSTQAPQREQPQGTSATSEGPRESQQP